MVKHDTYSWLQASDREELQEFATEISDAYCGAATSPDGWENLDAIIHEWHASAIAILSNDLTEAWQDTDEEVPLTSPVEYSTA